VSTHRALFFFLQILYGLIHRSFKPIRRSILQPSPVDKDRRRAPHTQLAAKSGFRIDLGQNPRVIHASLELTGIQTELGSNFFYFAIVQNVVALKQQIMKRPEFALAVGGQGRLRCFGGKGMSADGEVLKYNLDFLGILLEHLLEYRYQPGTVGSLEIAEHNDTDRCIGPSFDR
jgi:hypothetical protein